ncbi:unnamed protein product [Parascedosporium putredinis]|uniref:Uncharacterized protein n=1 Tax=Parascedosporium putredinis TaxID=1442378 RepID=A0A9P1MF75_9PEZI|nr:unnamed protein product [Parascedosporium putredinis]CAI8001894.1 unnamed protein product [Parascedosporium putredinis]
MCDLHSSLLGLDWPRGLSYGLETRRIGREASPSTIILEDPRKGVHEFIGTRACHGNFDVIIRAMLAAMADQRDYSIRVRDADISSNPNATRLSLSAYPATKPPFLVRPETPSPTSPPSTRPCLEAP